MSNQVPKQLSVTANPTFWELFIGSLLLLRYRWKFALLLSFFPLGGLFLLMTPLMGYRLGTVEILLGLMGFSYIPFIMALSVWLSRRRNKLAQGPFTYSFDTEGMHTSGTDFSQTIRWEAIPRIRRTQQFLFIMIAPVKVICIPLREIRDPQFFDELQNLAGTRTNFGGL